jgi:hypothetical protein
MNRAIKCLENCLERVVKITGGQGPRSKTPSSHEKGEACDIGRNSNPDVNPENLIPCFAKCFPNGYGQEENNNPGIGGTHFHLQLNTLPGGRPRFAPGIQPYTP